MDFCFLPTCVPKNLVLNAATGVVLWGGEVVREADQPNGRLGSPRYSNFMLLNFLPMSLQHQRTSGNQESRLLCQGWPEGIC